MPPDFLHNHKEFPALLAIVAEEKLILPQLVEKDYWIMHVLYGLQQLEFDFQLKGGTSLSKGYKIIDRFSEDIDIYIKPNPEDNVYENPNKRKPSHIKSRQDYYDVLAGRIEIDGITEIKRDTEFDDELYYRSGGIRLFTKNFTGSLEGLKDGILLEAGFSVVNPSEPITISSWAFDKAIESKVDIIDNRAIDVRCYHPGYTLIEKLQTITRKFRNIQTGEEIPKNLMRQYYDIHSLLGRTDVQEFIGTEAYHKHKKFHFSATEYAIPSAQNEAYLLSDLKVRDEFRTRYKATSSLYYNGQPEFDLLLSTLEKFLDKL